MKTRNLKNPGLIGLMLMACALTPIIGHAQGTIVYHDPPDHLMISRVNSVFHELDLDGNDTVDFVFRADTQFTIYSTTGNRSLAIPKPPPDLGSSSIPLNMGFEVGSELVEPLSWQGSFQPGFPPGYWVGQNLHSATDIGVLGYWQPNLTAYLGVEFQIDGNVHYGWIRLSTLLFPTANGGTIHDWAYNAIPNMPILAGQVPEPGTVALLLAGAGLLGWRTWRRSLKV